MMHLIYLKVAKVGTQNPDMTTSIERTVITLESGANFDNFVKHLNVQNFLMSDSEKPTVIKAVEFKDGKPGKEVDFEKYSKQVEDSLSNKRTTGAIDYKELSEKQSDKISKMEAMMADFEKRLEETTNRNEPVKSDDRIKLENKASELEIKYRSDVSDNKLLEKIQAVESDFELN